MKFQALLSSTALVAAALLPSAAFAQQPTTPPEDQTTPTEAADPNTLNPQSEVELESGQDASDPEAGEAVIVTGSRIRSPNLTSSVPFQSLGSQELLDSGDVSLGDQLNDLPALRSTFSQANSTRFIGTTGLNVLDLRGLGTSRTLVLVNGRRHVTSTPGSFAVDTNTIPQALLERTDVITGGSSAVYGSDAVAGVVNFVLRRDFDGIQARAQGGTSSRGDRGSYLLSLTAGRNFLDDRLNIAGSVEYTRQEQVFNNQRARQLGTFDGAPGFVTIDQDIQCSLDANGVPIPGSIPFCDPAVVRASDGIADTEFRRVGTRFPQLSAGGTVITTCLAPLAATNPRFAIVERQRALVCTGATNQTGQLLSNNFNFLDDGSLVVNRPSEDLRPLGGGVIGGQTSTGLEGGQLIPGSERAAANILMSLELSPAFQPFLEAKYVKIKANQFSPQATFISGTLTPTFSVNNGFLTPQARDTLLAITGNAQTFNLNRFNYDLGTRSELVERETYRGVIGIRGDLNESGSINYEISGNYGRTNIDRVSGGNVNVARFNRATNAVLAGAGFSGSNFTLNSQGQRVVCAVNADNNPANDDPECVPFNIFGQENFDPRAAQYVLVESTFEAKAEQINAVGFISATSEDLFSLPGGPIGAVIGAEYRRETASSDSDDLTQSGATFLNAAAAFNPPALELYEGFGELSIPILRDAPGVQELTVTAAGRASKYNTRDDLVYAYNGQIVYAPIRDVRFRAGYARSVRAPDLSELFQTPAQTFANGLVDPCNQAVINNNPNRVARCAEAGIPTTITLPNGSTIPFVNTSSSGISGFNQGNRGLSPEKGTSYTLGAVIQPQFLPGFSASIDFFDIEITQAISGLTGQAIVNACYEDPVSLDNQFCAAVFRRPATGDIFSDFTFNGQSNRTFVGQPDVTLPVLGAGFLNQPFNFARARTRGIDFDVAYRREILGAQVNLRAIVTHLIDREFFSFISEPNRATNAVSVIGDPEWEGQFSADFDFGAIAIDYDLQFLDRQLIAGFENNFEFQGRLPTNTDAFPRRTYPRVFYHDIRATFEVGDEVGTNRNQFRFYVGVDNVFDRLPPLGATGFGEATAIFGNVGRYFYAGAEVNF